MTRCEAIVLEPPQYVHSHQCPNRGIREMAGVNLCGTHLRVAEKWQEQGRLETMIKNWWKQ